MDKEWRDHVKWQRRIDRVKALCAFALLIILSVLTGD